MLLLTEKLENLAKQVTYDEDKLQHKVIFENEGQKTLLLAFSAGQSLPEHKTPKPALLVALKGICEFHIFGSGQLLRAGEVIEIPPRAPHHLTAVTNCKMLLLK